MEADTSHGVPLPRRIMARANHVPAIGLKIPHKDKPQKHFHYAVHTVPIHYTQNALKKNQFNSLGCFSLLVKDMRTMYALFSQYPSSQRLFISIYDTMSYDPDTKKYYLYKDIYEKNVNTPKNFYAEMKKHAFKSSDFDKKKVKEIFADNHLWKNNHYKVVDVRTLLKPAHSSLKTFQKLVTVFFDPLLNNNSQTD